MNTNNYHDVNNLRLELETTPAGLPNLVKNPSGVKGAWFWITPTANTAMTVWGAGASLGLRFINSTPQACNFTTDFMPVAASKYVSTRFDILSITASHNVKVTYDWYKSDKTANGSSAQSGALSTVGTNYGLTVQAPANTAYVKVRFNFYNGTGNANGNAFVTFNKAMVTFQDTGTVTTARTNLFPNPSLEVDTFGWDTTWSPYNSVARSTAVASVGSACIAATLTTSGFLTTAISSPFGGIVAGKTYTAQIRVRASSTGRAVTWRVYWYDASGNFIDIGTAPTNPTDNNSSWTTVTAQFTAPGGAAQARIAINWSAVVGETHYADAVLFEEYDGVTTTPTYFDGATTDTGTIDYAWTGTAHASTSTATSVGNTFGYSEPYTWRNILGPSHQINIDRNALNVGTMSAEVNDATLDPAVTTDIRPGKAVRLQRLSQSGVWESVYEGLLSNAKVTYVNPLVVGEPIRTNITLSAVDNISVLANRQESRGVPTIANLPYILEGKGVPWNVNGSGNQVTSATIVTNNDNASTLDQVAVTRDSVFGYAWVDRDNVLQVWDLPATPAEWNFPTTVSSWTADTNCAVAFDGTVGHTTNGSLKFTATAAGLAATKSPVTSFGVFPGDIYTASAWVKTGGDSRIGRIELVFYDAAGAALTPSVIGTNVSGLAGAWTQLSVTGSAPTLAVSATVRVVLTDALASTAYWVDDVAIARTGSYSFSDTSGLSYSEIDVDFDTSDCINTVTVKWLRYNSNTGDTEEVPYGPYIDQYSIDTWGPFAAEYTMQGVTESASAIQNAANAILANRATPVRKANSVTFPVRDATSFEAATIDLYALVQVNYSNILNTAYRVTSIKHTITPESWLITLDFSVNNAVASPAVTPSPPAEVVTTDPTRFYGNEQVLVGPTPPAGTSRIRRVGSAVVSTNASGDWTCGIPTFPNGVVTVLATTGDLVGGFCITRNYTLSSFSGRAYNPGGNVLASSPYRVNYIIEGW